jgi:hypothetical protein
MIFVITQAGPVYLLNIMQGAASVEGLTKLVREIMSDERFK